MSTTATPQLYLPNPELITGDEVSYRNDDRKLITLPRGCTYVDAMRILEAKREEQETVAAFHRTYNYRPRDGAVAVSVVLKSRYGISLGKATHGFFGSRPPEILEVAVGPGRSVQAPWGRMCIPILGDADVFLDSDHHRDYGTIFQIGVKAKKMYSREIEAFFADVAEQLANASIYRGKAVVGADQLEFISGLDRFNAAEIVFASDVQEDLETALFAPLRHSAAYRAERIPLKRSILVHGPYGTGKTSVGLMAAQEAVRNGWTFLMGKPGEDSIEDVMATARLYAPCLVWFEDIDGETNDSDPKSISRLLDAFDGVTTKGHELIVGMSTNHIDKIPAHMLRPGRLDHVIYVGELDRYGTEKLIRVVVEPGKLADDVDFDAIYAEMNGFLPAFVRATADRARSYAIHRMNGSTDYVLTTSDLAGAARSLHQQLELHQNAGNPTPLPTLDQVVRDTIRKGAHGMDVAGPGLFDVKLLEPGQKSRS